MPAAPNAADPCFSRPAKSLEAGVLSRVSGHFRCSRSPSCQTKTALWLGRNRKIERESGRLTPRTVIERAGPLFSIVFAEHSFCGAQPSRTERRIDAQPQQGAEKVPDKTSAQAWPRAQTTVDLIQDKPDHGASPLVGPTLQRRIYRLPSACRLTFSSSCRGDPIRLLRT